MEEALNNSIPASGLIRTLARQKRDLELENLELKRKIAVLEDDINEFKDFHSKAIKETVSRKSITKAAATVMQVQAQLGKKMGAITDLTTALNHFCTLVEEFNDTMKTLDINIINEDYDEDNI